MRKKGSGGGPPLSLLLPNIVIWHVRSVPMLQTTQLIVGMASNWLQLGTIPMERNTLGNGVACKVITIRAISQLMKLGGCWACLTGPCRTTMNPMNTRLLWLVLAAAAKTLILRLSLCCPFLAKCGLIRILMGPPFQTKKSLSLQHMLINILRRK